MSEKYWNICSFLNDKEVHEVWNIIEDALDRKGWVGFADDAELSISCLLYTSPSPRDR